jgi:hypothetical protein
MCPSTCLPTSPPRGRRQGSQCGWDPAMALYATCQTPLSPLRLPPDPALSERGINGVLPPQTATSTTTTRKESFNLYEWCVANRLRARIAIRHATGHQEVTISLAYLRHPLSSLLLSPSTVIIAATWSFLTLLAPKHRYHLPCLCPACPFCCIQHQLLPLTLNTISCPSSLPAKSTRRAAKR